MRGYLRQQRGYGKAEALLERKHPEKYSAAGHVAWDGRLYGNGSAQHRGGWRWHVYYGGWGTAFYQPLYGPRNGLLESLPLMPEWYLAISALAVLSADRDRMVAGADRAAGAGARGRGAVRGRRAWCLACALRVAYRRLRDEAADRRPVPAAAAREAPGAAPARPDALEAPRPRPARVARREAQCFWSEQWQGTEERVRRLEGGLADQGAVVGSGGDWDRWDLAVRGGVLGSARLRIAIEEHGAGRQHIRVRTWPRPGRVGLVLVAVLAILAVLAGAGEAEAASMLLASFAVVVAARLLYECSVACATARATLGTAFADVDPDVTHEPEPRRNLVYLAEQMRRSRVERLDVERVAKH